MSYTPALNYLRKRSEDLRGDTVVNPDWSGGRLDTVKYIAVHHDAQVRPAKYNSITRYRNQAKLHNGWGYGDIGLQYHYRIDNGGQIWHCRPNNKVLYHAGNWPYNQHGIAICVDGYFHPPHNQYMTREQYEALWQLIKQLRSRYSLPRSRVLSHRQVSATACNGDTAYPFIVDYRKTGKLNVPDRVDYNFPDWQPGDDGKAPESKPPKKEPKLKDPTINFDDEFEPGIFVAREPVNLYEIKTMNVVKSGFESGQEFSIMQKADLDGRSFLVTEYSADNNIDNGLLWKDRNLERKTPEDKPDDHEQEPKGDPDTDLENRVSALEDTVSRIVEFLQNVFSKFNT